MVRAIVVSAYDQPIPEAAAAGERVKISGGARYDLADIRRLSKDEATINLWTKKCIKDFGNLFEGDFKRLGVLLGSLEPTDYIDSEWCGNGNAALAACDAYRCRAVEVAPATGQSVNVTYFFKFAVSKTGQLLLLVSCHLSS